MTSAWAEFEHSRPEADFNDEEVEKKGEYRPKFCLRILTGKLIISLYPAAALHFVIYFQIFGS